MEVKFSTIFIIGVIWCTVIKQNTDVFNFQLNADNAAVYDTVIFAGPPPMKQRLWPRHCVQDTWGSELHKDLKVLTFIDCSP